MNKPIWLSLLIILCAAGCSSSSDNGADNSAMPETVYPSGCEIDVDLSNGPAQCSSFTVGSAAAVPADILSQLCTPAETPDSQTVIVIGDSFSEGVSNELQMRLGSSVHFCSLSSFGARTSDYMADRDLLNVGFGIRSIALAIVQRATNPLLIASIGSPDVGNDYTNLGNDVYRKVHCDLETIFDEFIAAAPEISIVISGYDIANLNPGFKSQKLSLSCPEAAAQQMNVSLVADPISGEQIIEFPRCMNSILYGLDSVFAELATASDSVNYAPAYGALQNRTPGDPDLDRFAESQYYRDCVHMNAAGQSHYLDALEQLGLL